MAAVVAVAVLLGGLLEQTGEASPSPSAAASATAEPTTAASEEPEAPSPSVDAGPTPPNPTSDLAWTEAGAFPTSGGASAVTAVTTLGAELVAVGVAYDEPLPNLGPLPPHEGRVWVSSDGTAWEDVTPAGLFENVALRSLIRTSDGALIVHGWADPPDSDAIGRAVTWESPDGRTWTAINQPFGDGFWPNAMAQGARGSAAVVVDPDGSTFSVWWSADGRVWERVHDLATQVTFSLGAGDEGFVLAGTRAGAGSAEEPFAIASGDGRAWFEADAPPGTAVAVAPRGGDWVAVSRDPAAVLGQPSETQLWSSANGLSWTQIGGYALTTVERSDVVCSELPYSLFAAGPWLMSGTMLSFSCSEGGVETKGTQLISLDGVDWTALPFGAPAVEAGLGTKISGALEINGRLVLVGDRDRVATFWFGESERDESGAVPMTWARGAAPSGAADVLWLDDRWLAVGGDTDGEAGSGLGRAAAWTSEDGMTWVPASPIGPDPIRTGDDWQQYRMTTAVDWGEEVLATGWSQVGCCDGGRPMLWRSEDGMTWEEIDLRGTAWGDTYHSALRLITHGDELVLLSGEGLSSRSVAWVSADGGGWTRHPISAADERAFPLDVASSDRELVAVGARIGDGEQPEQVPVMWTSVDGRTWAPSPIPPDAETLSSVAYAAERNLFVLVGRDTEGRAAGWTGGVDRWTRSLLSEESGYAITVRAAGNLIVALGATEGSVVWSSSDGVDWAASSLTSDESVQLMLGVAPNGAIAIVDPLGIPWDPSSEADPQPPVLFVGRRE